MLRETSYEEIQVPRKAAVLAARLSNALAPFFEIHDVGSEYTEFKTWGEETAVWKDRRDCFIRIFEIALKLKILTTASIQQYEFVVYPPGTSSSGDTAPDQGQTPTETSKTRSGCQFWKHASMYIYEAEDAEGLGSMTTALVQPWNFTARSASERAKYCLHSNAIVLPKGDSQQRPLDD